MEDKKKSGFQIIPDLKSAKQTGIIAGEVLGGFIGGHSIRTYLIKSDKKWINPIAALVSAYVHAAVKNENVKNLMVGAFAYYGIKSLSDLSKVAVDGLQGVEGMEGLREMLNKIVPSLGDAEVDMLSGNALAAAEAELLGLMSGQQEFTPYTEVASSPISGFGSISNL